MSCPWFVPQSFKCTLCSCSRSLHRGNEKKEKGRGAGGFCWKKPRRGARSENRISLSFSFSPPPHPVGPAEFLPRSGPGTMPRPDPHPPGVRHSPPRSVPRCRRLPRRRCPPWPWRVPPLTGPEAPAAAAASLLAARPRCSAPNAPLAVLLAAPPPAPHRRDPGRTPGLAH